LRGHSPEPIRRTGNKNSCLMLGKRCVIAYVFVLLRHAIVFL
jgi:hypothetical protein